MGAEQARARPGVAEATAATERGTGTAAGAAAESSVSARRWHHVGLAGTAYLALAVGLWWHVWTSHPSAVTTCGCGDAARFTWFFAWPVFALGHGQSLWHSAWLFHPGGFNLLDDTSVLALTLPLAPVTAVWGPVAAMNLAATLAPAASAVAMFVLLRRWVRPFPGAFAGGLLYGFSPFVVTELALDQLNLAVLVVPPLLALVLVDLVQGRRPPVRSGIALALLAVVQFFLSTELLLILAVTGAGGLVVALVRWWWRRRRGGLGAGEREAARRVVRGLATATAVGAAVLAVPSWYATAGPSHLSGPVWGKSAIGHFGTTFATSVSPSPMTQLAAEMHHFGGYQGPALPALGYLGAGVVALVTLGVATWWRHPRYRLVAAVAVIAWLLSLAPSVVPVAPWRVLLHVPLVGNIVEARFAAVTTGCLAVLAAVVVDRAGPLTTAVLGRRFGHDTVAGAAAAAVAVAVAVAVSVTPSAAALASNLPLATQPVRVPAWFAGTPRAAGRTPVVLAYPAPFSGIQSSMAWQALGGFDVAMAGGGGPASLPSRAGAARPGFEVLAAASIGLGPPPTLDATALEAVGRALRLWRVTTIVAPRTGSLLPYDRGRGDRLAAALFTAAIGREPVLERGAWVWTVPDGPLRPVAEPPARVAACAALPAAAAAACVLGGAA